MTKRTKELLEEALALPESEHEELVELLVPSLEQDPFTSELHAGWGTEIERRLSELRDGTVQAIPWDSVKTRLDQEEAAD